MKQRPLALVTGASSGIGQALLPLLASGPAGPHDLVLVARRRERLEEQQRALEASAGIRVIPLVVDLAEPGAAGEVALQLRNLGLEPDVLVNNAGVGHYGAFADEPLEAATRIIALNITALTELTHLLLPGMRSRRRGRILQVASTGAFQPGPHMAVYYATKAYVLSFSEALSVELAGSGVSITTLCPGPTRSEFLDVARFRINAMLEQAMMSSEEVARIGYRAMMRGERLAIAGTGNKLLAVASQLAPRGLVLAVTEKLLRTRGH